MVLVQSRKIMTISWIQTCRITVLSKAKVAWSKSVFILSLLEVGKVYGTKLLLGEILTRWSCGARKWVSWFYGWLWAEEMPGATRQQLPLATACWLLEVPRKTPARPSALVVPCSCCYSRRKAQAGWAVGGSPGKEDRRVVSSLQLQQSLSPFLTSCLTPHGFASHHVSAPASSPFFTSSPYVPPGSLPLGLIFSGPPLQWFGSHKQCGKKELIKKTQILFCLADKLNQFREGSKEAP